MARGNSRAQSEAGTIARADTPGRVMRNALETLRRGSPTTRAEDAADILAGRRNGERYTIDMSEVTGGKDSNKMLQVGKLNLIDGTIEGQPMEYASQDRGVIDRMGVKSTSSDTADYDTANSRANIETGFVFAHDGKQVYALPHTWERNDPAGSVGVFKGDTIITNGKELKVIGSFDGSKTGLQAAAVASGEALGRNQGVKQTAIVLTHGSDKEREVRQVRFGTNSVFGSQTLQTLRDGVSGNGDFGVRRNF